MESTTENTVKFDSTDITKTDATKTPETAKCEDKAIEPAPPAVEQVREHKQELRERVEARLCEMETALAPLRGGAGHEERIRSIETAQQQARDAIGGGWEHVGEMESAQLSQWLESSKFLATPDQKAMS